MSSKLFTSKKMKLEKKNWARRSIIGTVVVAILGAAGFGVYSMTGERSEPSRPSQKTSVYNSTRAQLPAFADTSNNRKALSGKKPVASKVAHKKKSNGKQKLASGKKSKKHKNHKYASKKKNGKKHHVAKHKKHTKKHLAGKSTHKKQSKHLASE